MSVPSQLLIARNLVPNSNNSVEEMKYDYVSDILPPFEVEPGFVLMIDHCSVINKTG